LPPAFLEYSHGEDAQKKKWARTHRTVTPRYKASEGLYEKIDAEASERLKASRITAGINNAICV